MARPKADFLIPRLNPALSPERLEKILSEEEIRVIQYMDGETSCSLMARLLGYTNNSLQAMLDTLANRGVVQLGYRTTDELHFPDYQDIDFGEAPSVDDKTPVTTNLEVVSSDEPTIQSIPSSLLKDLSPAIAEASLSPSEIRLLVFIDGATSVVNLATLLGSSPEEVLVSTKKLAEKGFIEFDADKKKKPLSEMSSPGFSAIPTSVQKALSSFVSSEELSATSSSEEYDSVSHDMLGFAFSADTSLDPGASLLDTESLRQKTMIADEVELGLEEDELELELEEDELEGSQALVFSADFADYEDEVTGDFLDVNDDLHEDNMEIMTFSSAEFSSVSGEPGVSLTNMPTLPPIPPEEEDIPFSEDELPQPGLSFGMQQEHGTSSPSLAEMPRFEPDVDEFELGLEEEEEDFPESPHGSWMQTPPPRDSFVEEQSFSEELSFVEEPASMSGLMSVHEAMHGTPSAEYGLESQSDFSMPEVPPIPVHSSPFEPMTPPPMEYEEEDPYANDIVVEEMGEELENITTSSVFFTSSEEDWDAPVSSGMTGSVPLAAGSFGSLPSAPSMDAVAAPVLPDSVQVVEEEDELSEEELARIAAEKEAHEEEASSFVEWFSTIDVEEDLESEVSRQVANIMVALARVTNSLLFYEPRNKAVRNALANFYAKIISFLKHNHVLRLDVEPWDIQYDGEIVYRNRDREQSLAYKLFRDGVRGVIFREGISWSELSRFLKILGVRYNGVHLFEEDIVTMLWKENFQNIEILAVEGTDLREEKAPLKEFAEELFSEVFDANDAERQQENYFYLPQLLNEESPYALLQVLQPRGYNYTPIPEVVTERLKQEFDIQNLSDRVFRLLDYLELECLDPDYPWAAYELTDLLAEFRDFLMTDGLLEELYHLLVRVTQWHQRSAHDTQYFRLGEIASELLNSFSEERVMKRFLDSLSLREEGHIPERAHDILDLLTFDKVPLFLQILQESKTRHLRDVLIDLLLKTTNNNDGLFIRLLPKANRDLRIALLYCLQGLQTQASVIAIVGELGHEDADVRRVVVKIIDELISEQNAGATVYKVITQLIDDPEPHIRNRAYKLIQLSEDRRWTKTLLRLVQTDGMFSFDELSRIARLVAWLSPEEAEVVFLEMAQPPGFFTLDTGHKREHRRVAISALGLIGTKKAEEMVKLVLQKLPHDHEPECIEALREMRRDDRDDAISRTLIVAEIDSLLSMDAVGDAEEEELQEEEEQSVVEADDPETLSEEEADKAFMKDLEDTDIKEVDVENIQMQLMKALTQAGADNEQNNAYHAQLRSFGQRLVQMLHMLIVSSRLYSHNNKVFNKPIQDLASLMMDLNKVVVEYTLTWIEGQFYLNETRIRMRGENALVADALYKELDSLGIGGFTFSVPMAPDQLLNFVHLLSGTSFHGRSSSLEEFREFVVAEGLDSYIVVTGRLAYRLLEEAKEVTAASLVSNYAKGIRAADSLWNSASSGRLPNPVPVRRCLNEFIDALSENDQSTLEVIALEDNANPLQAHFLRVALYATMIGMELNLPLTTLSDLGLAAFFHDIGYACSDAILNSLIPEELKTEEEDSALSGEENMDVDEDFLDSSEAENFKTQPAEAQDRPPLEHHRIGLRLLVRQRGFHDAKIKRLLSVYEHHNNFRSQFGYVPTLFARIIRVADVFDTLTSNLLPQPLLSPDRALGVLMTGAGAFFDQAAVQALINRMGRFPLGSILELSDGSLCISMGYNGNPAEFERPSALLYRSARGRVAEGQIISLADEDFSHLQIVGVHKDTPEINARKTLAETLKQRLQVEKMLHLHDLEE